MQPRLNLITLGVKDLKKSVTFYRDVVGLPYSKFSVGDVAFFNLKGTWLGLFPRTELAKDAGLSPKGSGFHGVTISHNVKSVKEVDAIFTALKKKGAKIVKPAKKAEWGGYSGYFADPDGHLWEVAHNPFFWPGPK